MALTEQRKGEIALALWKYRLKEKGIALSPETVSREAGNASKSTGIPVSEIKDFLRELIQELVEKSLSTKKSNLKSRAKG